MLMHENANEKTKIGLMDAILSADHIHLGGGQAPRAFIQRSDLGVSDSNPH